MPRYFMDFYKKSSSAYDQYVAALNQARYSDGEAIDANDISSFASTLILWEAVCYDLGLQYEEAHRYVAQLTLAYLFDIDMMFKDIKELVTLVRNCSDWDRIMSWLVVERVRARLRVIRILCLFPFWREETVQFRAVHGILMYPMKQTFNRTVLEEQAKQAYLDAELQLSDFFDNIGVWMLHEMRDIFTRWFKDWDESLIREGLKFSSGSTSDVGRPLRQKVVMLYRDIPSRLAKLLSRVDPSFLDDDSEWQHENCSPQWSVAACDSGLKAAEYAYAKTCFVPKTAISKRTICEERSIVNFCQNGLDWSLRHAPGFPRGMIRLDDQEHSRMRAVQGSKDGRLATVDFSAASDSIQWSEVQFLLSECSPMLLEWLDATRSGVTILGDDIIPLRKFAAMGSVVCFTVESCFYCAMAIVACRMAGVPIDVTVYGDDVILPSEAYSWYCLIADALHCKVNLDKSYARGPFRESCGTFAFKGTDITVPAASRKHFDAVGPVSNPTAYVTAAQMANEFFAADMPYSRYICIMRLVRDGVRFLSGSPEYEWTTTNSHGKEVSSPFGKYVIRTNTPIFLYSDYDGLRVHDREWIEEPKPLTKSVMYTLCHNFQCFPDDLTLLKVEKVSTVYRKGVWPNRRDLLPTPISVKERRHRLLIKGLGFETDVLNEKLGTGDALTEEDRLRIWLYKATYTSRQAIEPWGSDHSLKEPITVALRDAGEFELSSHKTILSYL